MAPPQYQPTSSETKPLQAPQPAPARVAIITDLRVRCPAATDAPIIALETPLQLQTWASAGISSNVTFLLGPPRSNSNDKRSSGSAVLRSNACIKKPTLSRSPIMMAPTRRPLRMISFL